VDRLPRAHLESREPRLGSAHHADPAAGRAVRRLVHPFGTARTDDGEDLAVVCPMCRVERLAQISTCGNCGLVLNVKRGIEIARPAGPPPGGAAIA